MRGDLLEQLQGQALDMANHIARYPLGPDRHGSSIANRAVLALREHPLASMIDPVAVLAALAADPEAEQKMAVQTPSKFADCQLVLFSDSTISIQLLVWMNGTTSIHDHNFNGAFRMITGRSLHCSYDFHARPGDATCGVAAGRLEFVDSEIIGEGDVRPIHAGQSFIHAAFHLDEPSVTLLVASPVGVESSGQNEYRGGRLSVDESALPLIVARQVQALHILHKIEPEAFLPRLIECMASADLGRKYWILRAMDRIVSRLPSADQNRLHDQISRQHDGPLLLDVLFREKLTYRIVSLRETIRDPITRFVLGLIVNVRNPAQWPSLFQQYGARSIADASAYSQALDRIFDATFWTGIFAADEMSQLREFLRGLTGMPEGDVHIPAILRDNAVYQTLFPEPVHSLYEGAEP